MATMYQKMRLSLESYSFYWSQALQHNPHLSGSMRSMVSHTPSKPNSAISKVGKLSLSNGKSIYAKIYGSGSMPKKYAILLMKGKGHKDTPSVKYGMVSGAFECSPLFVKTSRRSIYGVKNTSKMHVKKKSGRMMGSVGFFGVILSIGFFYMLLYWFSYLYSFLFSSGGSEPLHSDFYECGFKGLTDSKAILELQFSIIGIIFLIYELEIILFTAVLLNSYGLSFYLLLITILSMVMLGLSFWYEWERFGLFWGL